VWRERERREERGKPSDKGNPVSERARERIWKEIRNWNKRSTR
jgi:hypothetical protein